MGNIRLTKAQQSVIDEVKNFTDIARKYETFEDYFIYECASKEPSSCNTVEKYKAKNIEGFNRFKKVWEDQKKAIGCIRCNTKTLLKLEELNLIEIITLNGNYDTIRVLNY